MVFTPRLKGSLITGAAYYAWATMIASGILAVHSQVSWLFLADDQMRQRNPNVALNPNAKSDLSRWFLIAFGSACCIVTLSRKAKYLNYFALVSLSLALLSGVQTYNAIKADRLEARKTDLLLEVTHADYAWNRDRSPSTGFWDELQSTLRCCGVDNLMSWDAVRPFPLSADILPASCCSTDKIRGTNKCLKPDAFSVGCRTLLRNHAFDYIVDKADDFKGYLWLGLVALYLANYHKSVLKGPCDDGPAKVQVV